MKGTYGYSGDYEQDDWNYPGLEVTVHTGTYHHQFKGLTAGVVLHAIKRAEAEGDDETLESILTNPYELVDRFYSSFGS